MIHREKKTLEDDKGDFHNKPTGFICRPLQTLHSLPKRSALSRVNSLAVGMLLCVSVEYNKTQSKWGIITHMIHSHYCGSTAGHAACFDNSEFFCTTNCDYFIKVKSPKSLETMACQPTKITEAIKSV